MLPLIVSVQLSAAAEERFTRLRDRYFQPASNFLPAHVTMFHHLPDEEQSAIEADMERATELESAMSVKVTGLRNLGRGVAFTLDCPRLGALRGRLANGWYEWLTAQDRQNFKPHVTVQNKVSPELARHTFAELQAAFSPWEIEACGLHLWAYRNGPWDHLRTFVFPGAPGSK